MEELTIEQKAKAYDEAISKMKEIITMDNTPTIPREIGEYLFPKFKENENERIRQNIIRVFKGEISFTSEQENEKYIAWLEKQKDTSSIERVFRPVAGCSITYAATQAIEQQQLGYNIVLAFNGAYIPVEEKTADDIVNEYYSWIKKQGEYLENYDEEEKEKADFVGDGFVECHADFLDFKEGNTYWLEYIGDDKYNVRSDNLLGKTYHITPEQLYCVFTKQHCPKENNVNEETNGPTAYGKYVDKCLNEASKHFFSEGEDKYTVADLFYAGVRCGKSWAEKKDENKSDFSDLRIWKYIVDMVLTEKNGIGNYLDNPDTERIAKKLQEKYGNIEKQSEKPQGKSAVEAVKEEKVDNQNCVKPADKVESKFHPGDWVILNGTVAQILDKQKYGFVGLDIDGKDFFCNYGHTDSIRLWTIADAKDGDVLVDEDNNIGLYLGKKDDLYWESYIYLGCDNCLHGFSIGGYHKHKNTKPGTKEQRELFFSKMKEADYEWNSVSKELKRITKFKVGDWIVSNDGIFTGMITEVLDYGYRDTNGYFNKCLEDNYHLWTMQDAKCGDILISSNKQPFVYNGNYTSGSLGAYFGLNYQGELLICDSHSNNWTDLTGVQPATEEQRNMLFKKLHDSDYKWDTEKEELWHKYL